MHIIIANFNKYILIYMNNITYLISIDIGNKIGIYIDDYTVGPLLGLLVYGIITHNNIVI